MKQTDFIIVIEDLVINSDRVKKLNELIDYINIDVYDFVENIKRLTQQEYDKSVIKLSRDYLVKLIDRELITNLIEIKEVLKRL